MIAREGIIFIVGAALLTVLVLIGAVRFDSRVLMALAVILAVKTVLITFFFRDPERTIPNDPGLIVSPADGKVVAIEPISHPFVGQNATRVSIFLSVFDVHVNRVPAEGTIESVTYNPGKFMAAFVDKASMENEQTEIRMVTTDGQNLAFKQIAGLIARRIVCNLESHQSVKAGERFGLIRFGSRADIILPPGCEISVKVGDCIKGGSSIVAKLPVYGIKSRSESERDNARL